MTETKEERQEIQYIFPYHHITHKKDGGLFLFRHLFWGLEHYTYIDVVKNKIEEIAPKELTDVGCGEGRIISDLEKDESNIKAAGTDISDRAIKFAQAFCNQSNFYVHDILTHPLPKQTEMVISCEVIEHIKPDEVKTYINNIYSSLKPGGTVLITTPTENVSVIPKHYQHFTANKFNDLLGEKFHDIEYTYLNVSNASSWILNRLIANRFYLSNSKWLNRVVYNLYEKYLLHGDSKTGSRIMVVARK